MALAALFAVMLHAAFGVSHLLMSVGATPSAASETVQEIDLGLGIHVAICRAVGGSETGGKVPGKTSQSSCPICTAYTVAVAGEDPVILSEPSQWPDSRRRLVPETRRVVFEAAHDFLARGPPYSV